MDRIAPYADRGLCFAHYGAYPHGARILEMARNQLNRWVEVIRAHGGNADFDDMIADLIDRDPVFARIYRLPETIYHRERFFAKNAISGIMQYLAENDA